MSPENKRSFNTAVGSMFITIGVVAWLIAAYFAFTPSDKTRLPPISLAPSVEANSCRTTVATLYGFQNRMEGDDVVFTTNDIEDPKRVLESATAVIALCKRELTEFCMGTGCVDAAMSMTLAKPANQKRYVPTAAPASASAAKAQGAATANPKPKR